MRRNKDDLFIKSMFLLTLIIVAFTASRFESLYRSMLELDLFRLSIETALIIMSASAMAASLGAARNRIDLINGRGEEDYEEN